MAGAAVRSVLGAIQFLTVLPIRGETVPPGRAAVFFPIVGAWLGLLGAAVYEALRPHVPFAALLVVVVWILVTGALHEDGLGDVADGVRAGRTPERIAAIMEDSRVGTYGAAAIVVSVLVRWNAVAALPPPVTPKLVAALALSRASMVLLGWASRPYGEGIGTVFMSGLTTPVAAAVIVQALAASFLCGPMAGVVLAGAAGAVVLVARAWFHARLGGVTGDCMGATGQVVEMVSLVLLSCAACTS
ncbi:MAG TPA: adenosylcobinamide-GDP ribazoletransferase [Solibacterales bacterium]|nr:adenosylcobinamide-GDP ribazoletransferase [Bryobacterales bacterium]